MFKLKGIDYEDLLSMLRLLKLLCPAYFLLYLFKSFIQKDKEMGIDSDCSVRFACPPVLEGEVHALLVDVEGGYGVPGKLDHLVLQLAIVSTGVQPERVKGDNRYNLSFLPSICTTVWEDNGPIAVHLSHC